MIFVNCTTNSGPIRFKGGLSNTTRQWAGDVRLSLTWGFDDVEVTTAPVRWYQLEEPVSLHSGVIAIARWCGRHHRAIDAKPALWCDRFPRHPRSFHDHVTSTRTVRIPVGASRRHRVAVRPRLPTIGPSRRDCGRALVAGTLRHPRQSAGGSEVHAASPPRGPRVHGDLRRLLHRPR